MPSLIIRNISMEPYEHTQYCNMRSYFARWRTAHNQDVEWRSSHHNTPEYPAFVFFLIHFKCVLDSLALFLAPVSITCCTRSLCGWRNEWLERIAVWERHRELCVRACFFFVLCDESPVWIVVMETGVLFILFIPCSSSAICCYCVLLFLFFRFSAELRVACFSTFSLAFALLFNLFEPFVSLFWWIFSSYEYLLCWLWA